MRSAGVVLTYFSLISHATKTNLVERLVDKFEKTNDFKSFMDCQKNQKQEEPMISQAVEKRSRFLADDVVDEDAFVPNFNT